MEKIKGFNYVINGVEDLNKFSKGILALTNLKSSKAGTVIDIKTYEGSWMVSVVSIVEIDNYLKSNLGEISSKELIEIVNISFNDLNKDEQKVLNNLIDNDKGYFIALTNSDFQY